MEPKKVKVNCAETPKAEVRFKLGSLIAKASALFNKIQNQSKTGFERGWFDV